MKYAQLQQMAAAMGEDEARDSLRSLVTDTRFAAVVRLIENQKTLSADASSQLQFANSHGCLAHAAGVRYGMLELSGQIAQLCEPPKKRGLQKPEAKPS